MNLDDLGDVARLIGYLAAILASLGVIYQKGWKPWRRFKAEAKAAVAQILAQPEVAEALATTVASNHGELLDRLADQDTRLDNFETAARELLPNGGGSIRDHISEIRDQQAQQSAQLDKQSRLLDDHLQTCELIALTRMVGGQRVLDPAEPPSPADGAS